MLTEKTDPHFNTTLMVGGQLSCYNILGLCAHVRKRTQEHVRMCWRNGCGNLAEGCNITNEERTDSDYLCSKEHTK
jgi:hypothetical protein